LFVVLLITAPSYLEVGASDKPGAVQIPISRLFTEGREAPFFLA